MGHNYEQYIKDGQAVVKSGMSLGGVAGAEHYTTFSKDQHLSSEELATAQARLQRQYSTGALNAANTQPQVPNPVLRPWPVS